MKKYLILLIALLPVLTFAATGQPVNESKWATYQVPTGKMMLKIAAIEPAAVELGNVCSVKIQLINVEVLKTKVVLNSSLKQLFAAKSKYHGESGLMTATYNSGIRFSRVSLVGKTAKVYLLGSATKLAVCDKQMIKAQVVATAKQFPTVKTVLLYLNGKKF